MRAFGPAGRLSFSGFTSCWTITGAAFDLVVVTIAGPVNGIAFRFRGGRL